MIFREGKHWGSSRGTGRKNSSETDMQSFQLIWKVWGEKEFTSEASPGGRSQGRRKQMLWQAGLTKPHLANIWTSGRPTTTVGEAAALEVTLNIITHVSCVWCSYVHMEATGQPLVSFLRSHHLVFWDRVSHWSWSSPVSLVCQTSEPQVSARILLSGTGIINTCHHVYPAFSTTWVVWTKLCSLHVLFIHRAILPVPANSFQMWLLTAGSQYCNS